MNVVKEADIAAEPAKVYDYLVDFSRHSEWTTPGHAVHITPAAPGPTVVGSVFTCDAHQMGAQHDRIEVTELAPGQRIVYSVTMKDGNTFRHTLEMSATPVGTHLTKRFQSVKLSPISRVMSVAAGAFIAPKMVAGDVVRIKARIEPGVTSQPARQ